MTQTLVVYVLAAAMISMLLKLDVDEDREDQEEDLCWGISEKDEKRRWWETFAVILAGALWPITMVAILAYVVRKWIQDHLG